MLRRLLKSVREYRRPSLLCPLFMACEAGMDIMIPFIMTFVIEELEQLAGNPSYEVNPIKMVILFLLLIICALGALFFGVTGGKYAAEASCGFAYNLREDLYHKIQTFSFSNIDDFSTSSLITRITTDVTNVQNAFQMCVRTIVRAPVLLIVAIIMTGVIEWKISMIFISAAVLLGIVVGISMTKAALPFRTMFQKYDALNLVVQENLAAIRVVKSFVRAKHEMDKMQQAAGEVYYYSVKAEKIMACLVPLATFAMFFTNIVILLTGTNMAAGKLQGNVSAADLQTLVAYSLQILTGVLMVAMSINFVSMSKGSAERICEVLTEKPSITSPESAVKYVADGSIQFEHVDFSYAGKTLVLSDINLNIKTGETIGIIGATGSGKSSLISLIPRLYDVKRGEVKVGGINVKQYDLEVLRNQVTVVLQNNVLFSGTVKENLLWGDEAASDEEIFMAVKQACAHEFISEFPGGYSYDLGQGGVNVSGGQKQRICIARALLKKPKIIIFDDSTSAVDMKTDAAIREALKQYAPETTKIIIAQRVASVQDADRIVVLNAGQIFCVGSHKELLETCEIYRDLYESQMNGREEGADGHKE